MLCEYKVIACPKHIPTVTFDKTQLLYNKVPKCEYSQKRSHVQTMSPLHVRCLHVQHEHRQYKSAGCSLAWPLYLADS